MKLDLTNLIIYFLWNLFDIAVIIRYMNHLYGKVSRNKIIFYLTSLLIVIFVTVTMHPTENYVNIFAITSTSLVLLAFYPKNIQRKMLFSFIILVLVSSGPLVVEFISYIILKDKGSESNILVFIQHITFFVLVEFALKLNKSCNKQTNGKILILLLSIPVFSMAAFPCIIKILQNSTLGYKQVAMFGIPIVVIILYTNLMVFYIFERFSESLKVTTEKALLEQQLVMQGSYYEELESVNNRVVRIRHDMKNSLETALYLLQENQLEDAKKYLVEITNGIKDVEKVINTGNSAVDSILNIKFSKIRECRIDITTDIIIPKELKITFEQAVAFLGNIMDNAVEACEALPENQRYIKLKMRYEPHMLFLNLENAMSEENIQASKILKSRKEDKLLHGLGMKNVQKVVEDFQGTMRSEVKDGKFILKAVLYDI